eukprot:1678809-Rhodomonas_salina.2
MSMALPIAARLTCVTTGASAHSPALRQTCTTRQTPDSETARQRDSETARQRKIDRKTQTRTKYARDRKARRQMRQQGQDTSASVQPQDMPWGAVAL